MEKSEPSQMQLYSQIIAAYDNAGIWPLFKYVYTESGDKLRAKGWLLVLVLLGLIILSFGLSGIIICYLNIIKEKWFFILFWTLCVVTVIPVLAYVYYFEKKLKTVFSEDINNYGGLEKSFFNHRDFYRYILFRNELNKSKINPEYITNIKSLFELEKQNLGSYVARNPLHSWEYATLGATIAASATNWLPEILVSVVLLSFLALFILRMIPTFITNQKRQYELHRWFAWYKAEALKVSTPSILTPDGANPLPD